MAASTQKLHSLRLGVALITRRTLIFRVSSGILGLCPQIVLVLSVPLPSLVRQMQAADDAADARWYPVTELPPLAFDHKEVVREGFKHLAALLQGGSGLENISWKPDGPELVQQLLEGARRLEGPWDPPKE